MLKTKTVTKSHNIGNFCCTVVPPLNTKKVDMKYIICYKVHSDYIKFQESKIQNYEGLMLMLRVFIMKI